MYNDTIYCVDLFDLHYIWCDGIIGSKLRPRHCILCKIDACLGWPVGGAEFDLAWRDVSWTPGALQAFRGLLTIEGLNRRGEWRHAKPESAAV